MNRNKISSDTLIEAGLNAMRRSGRPLSRVPSKGRSMIYALPNGETVRMRTCNDHVLVVVGDRPTPDAKLNVEGTDWILFVVPEKERTSGKVLSYLLPTGEVEGEARRTHAEWLAGNPNTGGDNKTWNLWFRADGPSKANDYAAKWAKYRLVDVVEAGASKTNKPVEAPGDIRVEVEKARRRIAELAGVPVEAVKITINFEG